jgi:hypothetical protein
MYLGGRIDKAIGLDIACLSAPLAAFGAGGNDVACRDVREFRHDAAGVTLSLCAQQLIEFVL